ncbi:MAG TPA: protocatechuate 3,4-dioxygenase [Chloroflexota bacterium]|nr:protocatechuate 3,4-dioxygenase [Chloroflexota bacterium]
MAKIVLGLGTSHAPQLSIPPESWAKRGNADRRYLTLWYQGRPYSFDELREARADAHFANELTADKARARFAACQQAIAGLAETFNEVRPDLVVMIGDDQNEVFQVEEGMVPAFNVHTGETVDNAPYVDPRRDELGLSEADWGHMPPQRITYPCMPALGEHLVQTLINEGFDPAYSRRLPPGRHGTGAVGHAFGFVMRRIMGDQVVPALPVFINTYYPPNQPPAARCYAFGRALRRAIESWEGDQRVAIVTSGGLTHFVIEEDFDQAILKAMRERDHAALMSIAEPRLMSGNSEIKNWITLAGVLADSDLTMHLLDYVPCYRTEAGTGCGMAFARWN